MSKREILQALHKIRITMAQYYNATDIREMETFFTVMLSDLDILIETLSQEGGFTGG